MGSVSRIYFDHNATTPVAGACVDAMAAVLREDFGNPSSVHHFGQRAKARMDDARTAVARLLNADPSEIVFTGSGTEGDNLALRGAADVLEQTGRKHLVTSGIEHEAVLNTAKALARRGWEVTLVPVDASGIVSPDAVREALTTRTGIVSVMHANNEVGTVQRVAEIASIAKAAGAMMHVDAVQSAGKIPLDVKTLGADLVAISAHKLYGPKGVGALWIRRGVRLVAATTGGRHERGRRAGTENVAGIVGFGVAATLAREHREAEAVRLAALRDRLESGVLAAVQGTAVNGDVSARVPNTTNISFDRVEAESLLIGLDLAGIAVSTGSACSSGTLEPSHVLKAMGLPPHRTQNSIRFSLGAANTDAEVDRTLEVLPGIVAKLRSLTRTPARA
jgi:cysteine desulfurase